MSVEPLTPSLLVSGVAWILLGLFHSILGEIKVLRPLFRESNWRIRGLPRGSAETLLRYAWHATTITWFCLAGIALGLPVPLCLMAAGLLMGGLLFWVLRGHLAWPVFLVAGLGAGWAAGLIDGAARTAGFSTAVALAALALLHVYWALGGRRGLSGALPSRSDGKVVLEPGPAITLLVAALLLLFAGLILRTLLVEERYARALVGLGVLILAARAVGDGRYVGFTKRVRDTRFARLDDLVFTPIVVFLALGSVAALLA